MNKPAQALNEATLERHPCALTPEGADARFCRDNSKLLRMALRCAGCESPWRICNRCAAAMKVTDKSVVIHAASGLCVVHAAEAGIELEEETSDDMLSRLRGTGEVIHEIPVEHVRPRQDQPRQHFDEDELAALTSSIQKAGQQQPAIVVEIEEDAEGHRFELDDGERRWRACRLAGVPVLRATIVPHHLSMADRFMRSSMTNFNRADHTLLEEIDMVVKLIDEYGFKGVDVALALGKHQQWVSQRYGLRRLHPEVLGRLDPTLPRSERLGLPAALRLSPLPHEMQLTLLPQVISASAQEIQHIVRNTGGAKARAVRKRSPKDDYRTIRRGIAAAEKQLGLLVTMNPDDWKNAFRYQSDEACEVLSDHLSGVAEHLKALQQRLEPHLKK